jgi:hypothetical protein
MNEPRSAAPEAGASVYPFCIATCVSADALSAFLEAGRNGTLRDEHPWLIAAELLQAARVAGARVPLLLATEKPLEFRQWAYIERIDVVEIRRGSWESACEFRELTAMNPIWNDIDSVLLKPGDDQLRRERLEPIRIHRFVLDAQQIHPYAVCETPAFIASPSPPRPEAARASGSDPAGRA